MPTDTIERSSYGFGLRLDLPYAEAMEKVKAALKKEGFGVLTEIDVKATMKEKLGVDFRAYSILGVCNPPLAHRALTASLDIGLLLPCNVIVYEENAPEDGAVSERKGGSVVRIIDPEAAMNVVPVEGIYSIACEAKEKLETALESLVESEG